MANILENLRNRSEGVLRMTQDKNLVEQIDAIKKTTGVDTALAILLHSNHFDSSWNPNIDKKLQEEIDKRYKPKSFKNLDDVIFNFLDGWIIEEDIFWLFYDKGIELNYDPTDGADKLHIIYFLTQKIKSIFPVDDNKAFNLANDFINYKIKGDGIENQKFYPRPDQLMEGVLDEHEDRRLNPPVKPGDHIRLISIDHDAFPPNEYEEEYMPPEHLALGRVDMVYQDEAPNGEEVTMLRVYFPGLEAFIDRDGGTERLDDGIRILVDPYDKYVKTDEVLTEAGIIGGSDNKSRPTIPDNLRKNLVKARFERPGGWGRPGHVFILYITPTGKIMDISYGGQTPKNVSPFGMDQQVTFGELYKFEQNSPFDLQMKGRLREHDEQLSMFPTGTWEFPVGWDEESIEAVIEEVPEKAIKYIFKQWNEHGIDFRDLKLLGIQVTSDIAVFLIKRYLQNTNQPVTANHVFDCDDLTNLFETDREYNLDYIKEFLCGDSGFWDFEDWYNYEWDDYMTDQIDENNWKTISEIFGGVSQSVAEDILNRNSSSEEVDELTEKYDAEIDEIRSFIVWAHNDEHEWAVKEGMRKDILDKLAEHFGADGELYRSDEDGSYSWHFEDDVRNWVNDGVTWDNIERFEFHPDYAGTTLEDSLIDTSPEYLNEKTIFAALIDEEYMFHDYCGGKKGECLQVDTKFFDGYWHPDYDINSTLEDRLGEMTYDTVVTTPEGETEPLNEQQSIWGNGVMDREKEWCEDDENWLCNTGSENLGFSDLYTDDGFDIIHNFPGDVHLSDLSPEEKETRIPNTHKKKRFKKLKLNPDLSVGPFNIPTLIEQEKKLRVKTIFEDDNWKYSWPVDDYSFCQLGADTDWCENGEKPYEGDGTSYILQDKNTNEKFWFSDKEKVPGLPSGDVTIKDSNNIWQNVHRFLSNKQTLHDMFRQKYSTFDLMKYGVKLDPNILKKFSKTNKFAEAVYRMTDYPNDEKEEELSEFMGDKLTDAYEHGLYNVRNAKSNTISFNDDGVSLYIPDNIFKEKYMNVDEDDEWYFDIGSERYYNDDHCEEMDSEELQYIGYHINADNKRKLNNLVTLFGKNPDDYPWGDEGTLDEMMEKLFPNIWDNNYWELLDAIGCSVGRARVRSMVDEVQNDKVLEYTYEGGNDELWKLDITYIQLLYIIGDKKINNFSELEDTEINHIDGGLHDVWYDAWDVDEEGLSDFNYALNSIIDKGTEYLGDDMETILNNREKYEQIIKDLGFAKKYDNSNFEKTVKIDDGTDGSEQLKGEKRVSIVSYDPKSDEVEFQVSGPNYYNKRHRIPLDQLSDYVVSKELFESH